MNKIGVIEYKKIKRVTPSQFNSMKNCAYKSLLAEAFNKQPLLPVSPNAHLGTVLHKMLELISKGIIRNELEFNTGFDYEVRVVEEQLKQAGYGFFVPLQMNVRDFGLKKIQLKKHLKNTVQSDGSMGNNFISEKWLQSKDGLIGGKADLIIESLQEVEIIDFKTGAITEDAFDDNGEAYQEVKSEYQEQLKLYAYLYFDNSGKFPTRLSIVDLAKQKFNVDFTNGECQAVFENAKELLNEVNRSIETKAFKANPCLQNCKYCFYRPACSFYLSLLPNDNSFNDATGTIKNVIQYENGNVSVFLENKSNTITVTGFIGADFNNFNDNRGKQIGIFNLRKEATPFIYSATKTTMIYE